MKKSIVFGLVVFFSIIFNAQGQTVLGKWKTIDDETGEAKSIVEVYEKSGKIYAKVVEILRAEHKKDICTKCEGADKNKPILGLHIIKGLSKNGDTYEGGSVVDPKSGKSYSCKISLKGKDKLVVRGYIGISLFGRSQTWIRQK